MNIVQAKTALKAAYKANLPTMLSGSPGLGKSEIIRQLREDLEAESGRPFGCIIFKPQTADISEMGDLRWIVEEDGVPVMKNVKQGWIPTLETVAKGIHPDQGIIFLDEILDCAPAIQSVLQGLVLDRHLGTADLHPGWFPVAASNRRKDNAAAGRMSTALARRLLHITVDTDVDVTVAYAYKHDWHPMIPAFLRWKSDLLDTSEQAKKQTEEYAFANPASWEKTSTLLKSGCPDDLMLEMISGLIGKGPAGEFYAFLQVYKSLPDLNVIRNTPETVPIPEEPSVMFATLGALVNKITKRDFIRVWPFVRRLQPEYATYFTKSSVNIIGPDIVNSNPAWDEYLVLFASYTY